MVEEEGKEEMGWEGSTSENNTCVPVVSEGKRVVYSSWAGDVLAGKRRMRREDLVENATEH